MKEGKHPIILAILWNFLLTEEQRPKSINMPVINLPEISELLQMCAVLQIWITELWSPSCIRLPHIPTQVPIWTIFKELGVHMWVQSDLPWTHVGFWTRHVSKIMNYKHNYTHFHSYRLRKSSVYRPGYKLDNWGIRRLIPDRAMRFLYFLQQQNEFWNHPASNGYQTISP